MLVIWLVCRMTRRIEMDIDIMHWCEETIADLHTFERCEMAVAKVPRDVAVAAWVLRCLANIRCPGGLAVLEAIHERRDSLKAEED